jgi:hypothetical protein
VLRADGQALVPSSLQYDPISEEQAKRFSHADLFFLSLFGSYLSFDYKEPSTGYDIDHYYHSIP